MVGRNLILVRGILSFISSASEKERKSNQNRKNKLGNTLSFSTENKFVKTALLWQILKQSIPAHSYITGIYHNN